MARNIVKAKLDIIFKKIFTDKNNEDFLKCFLSDILDIPYEDIHDIAIENTEITPEEIDGKFTRFDMKLTVDQALINVEIQVSDRGDFPERSLYYWAQTYGTQLKKGDNYSEIKPTISINIVNYALFDTEDYYSKYTMADLEHGKILTDKCAMHYFELSKINRKPDKTDRKKLWMQLINSESEEELEMLQETNVPAIQQGVFIIRELSEDERMREMSRRREIALRDERSALGYARRAGLAEGIEIGKAEGKAEGRAEAVSQLWEKMRSLGYSEADLAKIMEDMK